VTVSSAARAATPEIETYLAAARAVAAAAGPREPARLTALRRKAAEVFAELGFPTPQHEDWRFTNVAPLARTAFTLNDGATAPAAALQPYAYRESSQVVLVNGRFAPELARLEGLPDGVVVCGLAEAVASRPALVEPHLGQLAFADDRPFVALNTALWRDGVLVWVPRGVIVERPLNLVLAARPGSEPMAFFPRLLVVAEESSQLTVFEQHVSLGEGVHFTCPVLEIRVGPNATVDHYKLQRESVSAFHMSALHVEQARDSTFSSHCLSWGGGLVRNDVHAILAGPGSHSTLNGLYMVEGRQLVDNHMRIEHAAPHCASRELYKGILEGHSRAVFTGRIYVHPGAQKTDGVQTNRNLLLSKDALCNSQPQLEIFADDVKCTHGSTVGELDETAVFYLRSRGIGEEAARSLLTYAFASDIVQRIRVAPVRRDLEEFLFRRLPRGEVVRQAV
jgi:Fe-S cluster assembly protein SufD